MLKPSSYLIYSLTTKKIEANEYYYRLNFSTSTINEDFKSDLFKVINSQVANEVSVGTYLSGGFDSSSVSMAYSKNKTNLNAYTLKVNDLNLDENELAKIVSKKINFNHNTVFLEASTYLENLKKVTYYLDEPTKIGQSVGSYLISKEAQKKVKVLFGGHGGDEIFAGYPVHLAQKIRSEISKNPLMIFNHFSTFLKSKNKPSLLYHLIGRYFWKDLKFGILTLFTDNELSKLLKKDVYKKVSNYNLENSIKNIYKEVEDQKLSEFDKIQFYLIRTYLSSLLLVEDKSSMANSIETRVPLCDDLFIGKYLSLPKEMKLKKNVLKSIIKDSMQDELPESLYSKSKKGFNIPLQKWFKDELKSNIEKLLLSKESKSKELFNQEYLLKILSKKSYNLRDAQKIFAIINIEYWLNNFGAKL